MADANPKMPEAEAAAKAEEKLKAMKHLQRNLRSKMTTTHRGLETLLLDVRSSRRAINALLTRLQSHLQEAEKLSDEISVQLEDDKAVDSQNKKHLDYVKLTAEAAENVDKYMATRVGEADSVVSLPQGPTYSELARQEDQRQRQIADAQRAAAAAQQLADDAAAAAETRRQQREAAEQEAQAAEQTALAAQQAAAAAQQALQAAQAGRADHPDDSSSSVSRPGPTPDKRTGVWVEKSRRHDAVDAVEEEDEEGDEWIDRYISGCDRPVPSKPSWGYPHYSTPLPKSFTGKALDWLGWAENFYTAVHHTNRTTADKLYILKENLKQFCPGLVIGAGVAAYKEGLRRLKQEYGNRAVMRAALLQEVDGVDLPRGDPAAFKRSAILIRTRLFELSQIGEANATDIIERISQRMQVSDRLAWNESRGVHLERRTLNQFGEWLCNRAEAYQNVFNIAAAQSNQTSGKQNGRQGGAQSKGRGDHHARAHQSTSTADSKAPKKKPERTKPPFCFRCEGQHYLEACDSFKKSSVGERQTFLIRHNLCFMCFFPKHDARSCSQRKACGIDGCTLWHHGLMHQTTIGSTSTAQAHGSQPGETQVALGVVHLDAITADGERIPVTVMIDECNTSTLLRTGLVRRLNARGVKQVLHIHGVAQQQTRIPQSELVEVTLVAGSGKEIVVKGSTLPVVTSPAPVTDWAILKSRWPHLADLPLRSSGGRVDIMLGLDYGHLMGVLESRIGREFEPIASRTELGWVVRGVVGADVKPTHARVHHMTVTQTVDDYGAELTREVRRMCDTEDFGTEHQSGCLSADNQRAVEMLDASTVKLEVGYQAPVLWKEGEPRLENNRPLADSRNRSLMNRFRKDPLFETKYRAAMNKNFDEGYAVRLSEDEIQEDRPVYYLAHFGVYKNNPGRDIRIVYDAAAKYRGRCLNDAICSGPALQNPLPAVLIKFREGAVAWAADIKAMYSRIRLPPDDQHFHRFLWPEMDGSTSVCKMTRVTFGVNCSPYVAIRTTWRVGEDAGPDWADATAAIKANVYVDDYLGSARNGEQAILTASGVKTVLAKGDFHLHGFLSNDLQLVAAVEPTPTMAPGPDLTRALGADDAELVLGVSWRPQRDTLGFRVTGIEDVQYTRVGLLSRVARLFDPLGTAAPMTVKAKVRLRSLGVKGLNWTDPVDVDDRLWWENYFLTLKQLADVDFPRCLFPDEDQITQTELHTFGDASEEAFAAVVYVRSVYQDGRIIIRQVKAATKLAPTKTLSIPRLELNAALLGSRLARFVQLSLKRTIDARYFWTDSSTVRNWIRATAGGYQTFVAHRVGEIQTLTESSEWRFVPGSLNPSDAATRSDLESEAIPYTWMHGPSFLQQPRENWPADLPWMAAAEELRKVRAHHAVVEMPAVNWTHVKFTAEDVPAIIKLDGKYKDLVRRCQSEAFHDDLDRLKRGKPLKPSSRLLALTPVLDEDGLLRLGGRTGRARLPYDRLHPPILPGQHPFTRKVIVAFHERLRHGGTDYVLTQVRHHFWLTQGREAVKKIQRECQWCIRQRARPLVQLMGNLPACRLDAGTLPFTHTACDYFGPMETSPYRNRVNKRWGALFTCMVTRAVYVDLSNSLSSEDFLLILRRFMALHGKPKQMFSDNGTNFVGAERELREAVEALHGSEEAKAFLHQEGIEWHFQPARTPHFGGAHESLVRLTKTALYAALDQEKSALRYPTDDLLRTLLFEVAGHLNSRPLWCASADPKDLRPLTPNDFLNRPPTADLPAGDFTKALPRDQYRYLQRALTLFWEQWRGPYLQSLAARKKWTAVQRNLSVGDFVLENDPDVKRGEWKTGRVVKTHPGTDGLVRAVDVEFPSGILTRGIRRLCLLETGSTAAPVSGENVPAKAI